MSNYSNQPTATDSDQHVYSYRTMVSSMLSTFAGTYTPYSRTISLHGEAQEIRDPWARGDESNFQIDPKSFLTLAFERRPKNPKATVSDFAEWVRTLYASESDLESIQIGRNAEKDIFRDPLLDLQFFRASPYWTLIHLGMDVNGRKSHLQDRWMNIPSLKIDNHEMRASPDMVFQSHDGAEIVIVEVKFSMKPVPLNLWPNIWAQLWAYSHIPSYRNVPSLEVIGEVWGRNSPSWASGSGWYGPEGPPKRLNSPVYIRRSVIRDPRADRFNKFFCRLFEAYGGRCLD